MKRHSSIKMKSIYYIAFIFLFLPKLFSQTGSTTCYPQELYPGMNYITIKSTKGIERITFTKSAFANVVIPSFKKCTNELDVSVEVLLDSTQESVSFTVFTCDDNFTTFSILQHRWQIQKEKTGKIRVGRDTCLKCIVYSAEKVIIDSINIEFTDCKVKVLRDENPPYLVESDTLHYNVCFTPTKVLKETTFIKVYVKRNFPNKGLFQYVINKPLKIESYIPEVNVSKMKASGALEYSPAIIDPTYFRNIAMPTAQTIDHGKFYVGNYDLVGWIAGIALAPRIEMLFIGSYIPDFITKLRLFTIGLKVEPIRYGLFNLLVGAHYAISDSKDSKIETIAPYSIISFGDKQKRISFAGGHAWKEHTTPNEIFQRNASIAAIGGYYQIGKNWKIAGEWYYIETSGIAPIAVTGRYFTENLAFDFGFGIDVSNSGGVNFTSALGGEIKKASIAPILSLIYVF